MENSVLRIGAVGDVFLGRDIQKICEIEGYDYPFRKVANVLGEYDIVFANLENPISEQGAATKNKDPHMVFRGKPESVNALKHAGINIVSLANNHMNDYGQEALLDTCNILRENNLLYVGAGKNEKQARKHLIIKKNQTRIAFLGYYHFFGRTIIPAMGKKPGVAHLDKKKCVREIKKAKEESDIVIVSVHWGIDYYKYPSPYYIELARNFIDSGCDIIIGHHPHVLQGYEQYNGGLIFYSLGNFVFDDPNPESRLTAILEIIIEDRKISEYRFVPIYDDGSHQLQFAEEKLEENIKKRIENFSEEYRHEHWKRKFYKDPTDRLILCSIKSLLKGGSIYNLKIFPMMTFMKRILPLFFFKLKQYFLLK